MRKIMTINFRNLLILLTLTAPVSSFSNEKKPLEWKINNRVWTKSFEKSYEEFIATLGSAKEAGFCNTTNDCLKNRTANPRYYNLNPDDLKDIFTDCADLPYTLRAYFSWMNDLPFSYPIVLSPAPWRSAAADEIKKQIALLEQQLDTVGFFKKQMIKGQIRDLNKQLFGNSGKDIRYNKFGNIINEKRYVKNGMNINAVLTEVSTSISTASFRTNANNNTTSKLFRDTYPVSISISSIKPGTILYDPNGHIAIVYKVADNGKIHLFDAHPDNSLSNITYGEKFSRTTVDVGGGFSNWRSFSYDDEDNVTATSNEDLSDFSLEQFQESTTFIFNGKSMDFYEYVRNKLFKGTLVYHPVEELKELLDELCHDFQERNTAILNSLTGGLQNKNHIEKLPENIYGTDGDWEIFSSPSRDARLKASIREGKNFITKMISGFEKADPIVQYNGVDIVGDLTNTYNESTKKCVLPIQKTNGTGVSLDLNNLIENVYKLSFDPFHCVELRWGLIDQDSLRSCAQSREKLDWYNSEQGLRNRIDRDYSMKMDYSLSDLANAAISNVKQEDISLRKALQK